MATSPPLAVEVRCTGCGETLEVENGTTDFACPGCGVAQRLPQELMPPPRRAIPLPAAAGRAAAAAHDRVPCGCSSALLTVPPGFACPICGVAGRRPQGGAPATGVAMAQPLPPESQVLGDPQSYAGQVHPERYKAPIHLEQTQGWRPNHSSYRDEAFSSLRADKGVHGGPAQPLKTSSLVVGDSGPPKRGRFHGYLSKGSLETAQCSEKEKIRVYERRVKARNDGDEGHCEAPHEHIRKVVSKRKASKVPMRTKNKPSVAARTTTLPRGDTLPLRRGMGKGKSKMKVQDMHPRMSGEESSRRPSRATARAASQHFGGDGDSSPSSDDDESEEYRMEHLKRKSTGRGSDDSSDGSDDFEEEIEEKQVPPVQHPTQGGQAGPGTHLELLVTHPPNVPPYIKQTNYRGKGMTGRAREQRRIDPRGLPRILFDHRFHTMFHVDFYTSVILVRNPIVAKSQWVDWQYVRELQKPSIDHAIAICQRTGVYDLMEFQHDWNTEVIAQFYATLYVEEEPRRMHWMLEGQWYSVEYGAFAALLGFSKEDLQGDRINSEQILPPEQLDYMYPPEIKRASVGKVVGLHPTYRYLDRMFRKTIDCKGGDKGTVADYSRNLLHRMAPDARPFSLFDFIWCEIKSVGERPLKGCGFAPYIMHMIEQVTGHTFEYDKAHKALRIVADIPEIGVPPAGPGAGATAGEAPAGAAEAGGARSPSPRAPPHSTSRRGSPLFPIRKFFSSLFGMCMDIQIRQRKEREARRKDTRTLKMIAQQLELQPPRSPLSDDIPSEPETEEQQQARYERQFAEFFQRQQSQQQQQQPQEDSQEHTQQQSDTMPLQARVPPHIHPHPSVGEEMALAWWSNIFGGYSYPTNDYGYGGLGFQSSLGDAGQSSSCPLGGPHSDVEGEDDDDEE